PPSRTPRSQAARRRARRRAAWPPTARGSRPTGADAPRARTARAAPACAPGRTPPPRPAASRHDRAMAVVRSAGVLLWRRAPRGGATDLEVLLGHMGGPLWSGKDQAAWSIPKGLYDDDEPAIDAARREFEEELG